MKRCVVQGMLATVLYGLVIAHDNYAQLLDKKITLHLVNVPLEGVLKAISDQAGVRFFYSRDHVNLEQEISIEAVNKSLQQVFEEVFHPLKIRYHVHEKNATVTLKLEGDEESKATSPPVQRSFNAAPPQAVAVITGVVTDAQTQQPMAGVNVVVKGTTNGTTTDSNGNYSIEAQNTDILVFSFIGYASVEMQVVGRSKIDIELVEDTMSLNEVVINAGYWVVKEKEQTGNISRITSAEIGKQPVSNPLQALQGRMSGVYIQQTNGIPGSNMTIRIRGQNSINSGNEPLYIVDGVPFMPGNLSSTPTSANILGTAGVSPLNSINPSDIESIDVLKDADATAIYGSRGANGVVLITTKRGKPSTSGMPKVDISFYSGASSTTRKITMLNTMEYIPIRREAFEKDGFEPTYLFDAADLLAWDTTRYTDWQEELIGGTARINNIQASISGGNEETQFSFQGGYENQGTVFPGELNADKISSRLAINSKSRDERFKGMFSVMYSVNSSNLIAEDLTTNALTLPPNAPELYQEDGSLNWENSTWQNPLSALERRYESRISNLVANANLSYEIIKGLEVGSSFGLNDMRMTDKNFTPSTYYDPAYMVTPASASININTSSAQSWVIEPKLNWVKKIGPGSLTVVLGGTVQEMINEKLVQYGKGFSSDALIEDIGAAASITILDYILKTYRYSALFGRVNYDYKGKYILNLTARRDGSSRFGPGKKYANFGAVGGAWIFSREKFMSALPHLSFGKIRMSYGTSGNDQIGDYQYLSTYQSSGAPYNGVIGLSPTRLFNPDFAWEVNKKFEVGLEIGFLSDRIMISTSYYRNRSSNQLINYPLAMTTGFNGVLANLDATVQNTGLEVVVNSINVKKKSIGWSSSLNITIPRNELVSFPLLSASSYANRYVVGEPLSVSKRYHYLGVDAQSGIHQFEDMNEDGVITTADKLELSNVGLNYYGGLNNSLSIGNFQFDIFFQFVSQTGVNYWGSNTIFPGYMVNQPSELLDNRWSNPGDLDRDVQVLTAGYNFSVVSAFFDHYVNSQAVVTDASFVRLKNVSLSYEVPIGKTKGTKARFYVQGQNVWTFTNFFGLDPENYNASTLPILRTYVGGLQFTF